MLQRNSFTTDERLQKRSSKQALHGNLTHVRSRQVEEQAEASGSLCPATRTRHRRRVRRAQDARRVHRSPGTPTPPPTRRYRTPSVCFCPPGPRPQLRRRTLTLLLQPVLSQRVAAMFEARYGCHPVVSGEPNWLVEFKKLLGKTMKPFVKLSGPWDM